MIDDDDAVRIALRPDYPDPCRLTKTS